ncbi:MAG TPA: hypothetical protein DDZ96_01700 [Porphyromonadaceae bacterium]|nr:hypothetical protein [Porphyromonadaceae bacterium]HBK33194.1 hypothetical protein [Porphyromonadaceae bacterium]HBL32520.1 hypothetical protein [Porphyromonadaceae bacterium]HBX20347.1 hypothetical protein [Porphyromonadaceae bacterium]HCM21848.1 hypothetical protein [Porphyromonadaceae bacterium]
MLAFIFIFLLVFERESRKDFFHTMQYRMKNFGEKKQAEKFFIKNLFLIKKQYLCIVYRLHYGD